MLSSRPNRTYSLASRLSAVVLLCIASPSPAVAHSSSAGESEPAWDSRRAEHLANRAGFGASPEEIAELVDLGLKAAVDRMVDGRPGWSMEDGTRSWTENTVRADVIAPPVLGSIDALFEAGSSAEKKPALVLDKSFYLDGGALDVQSTLRRYSSDWIARMISGGHPLLERMTLFWHGHFVSSFTESAINEAMIPQIEFLRSNALGDFEQLVRGISRNPAMLKYLNNDLNVKTSPNENWARELMELFTLGEGNYTEDDIKEAARAFSGWTVRDSEFYFAHDEHDFGPKTVLGVTGNLNGGDVIEILMEQEASARFIAGKLLTYFEGVEPDEARLNEYSQILRSKGFSIGEFLRTLFMDEGFYRDEVVGNRIAAPLEFFTGMVRRLGVSPPPDMLFVVSGLTGQRLMAPPNVKGWEEGLSWLTTSSVMQRGNFGGILLGEFDRTLRPHEIKDSMVEAIGRAFNGPYRDYLAMLAWLQESNWKPDSAILGSPPIPADASETDRIHALLDRVLAVPVGQDTADQLKAVIAELRPAAANDPTSAQFNRTLIHVILSLPEAQVL